jgi:hypothetical protein
MIGGHALVTFSSSATDILFFPVASVVFLMSQHVADVNLVSIIMHRRDQSNFVASNIEDREFSDLVGLRESLSQLDEV